MDTDSYVPVLMEKEITDVAVLTVMDTDSYLFLGQQNPNLHVAVLTILDTTPHQSRR